MHGSSKLGNFPLDFKDVVQEGDGDGVLHRKYVLLLINASGHTN